MHAIRLSKKSADVSTRTLNTYHLRVAYTKSETRILVNFLRSTRYVQRGPRLRIHIFRNFRFRCKVHIHDEDNVKSRSDKFIDIYENVLYSRINFIRKLRISPLSIINMWLCTTLSLSQSKENVHARTLVYTAFGRSDENSDSIA